MNWFLASGAFVLGNVAAVMLEMRSPLHILPRDLRVEVMRFCFEHNCRVLSIIRRGHEVNILVEDRKEKT